MKIKILGFFTGLFLFGTLGLSGQAFAHIITFDNGINHKSGGDIAGSMDAAIFPNLGETYEEEGFDHSAIGFGTTPGNSIGVASGGGSHVHGKTFDPFGVNNRVSRLEADAGGGLFQLVSKGAFGVDGFDILFLETRHIGPSPLEHSDVVLRGYRQDVFNGGNVNDFIEVALDGATLLADWGAAGAGGGSSNSLAVDVAALSPDFSNIYLFEYWFGGQFGPGRGNDPAADSKWQALQLEIDNVDLHPVAAIPIPAAIYLFGTAIAGLFGVSRRKDISVVA